jgi:hypothetical protein
MFGTFVVPDDYKFLNKRRRNVKKKKKNRELLTSGVQINFRQSGGV